MTGRRVAAVLGVLLLVASAFAGDDRPGWQRAAEAARKKDTAALAALASEPGLDPWVVADELLARKETDAAAAFAAVASKRKESAELADYVASRRSAPSDDALRKAHAAVDAALRAEKPAAAIAAAQGMERRGKDVPSVQLQHAYGLALLRERRYADASVEFGWASDDAESIGWTRMAWRLAVLDAQAYDHGSDTFFAASRFERAVKFAEKLDDKAALARACADASTAALAAGSVGNPFAAGKLERALELADRAHALHTELGDRGAAAGDSANIGIILLRLGSPDEAAPHLTRGLAEATAAGHRQSQANATSALGILETTRRNHDKAVDWFDKARAIQEAIGDERGVAGAWMRVGGARLLQGRLDEARAAYEKALSLQEKLGWEGGVTQSVQALGKIALGQKRPADAVRLYERARKPVGEGHIVELFPIHAGLAQAYEAAGDRAQAEKYHRKALEFVGVFGDEEDARTLAEGAKRLGIDLTQFEEDDRIRDARTKWASAQAALAKGEKAQALVDTRAAASILALDFNDDYPRARLRLDAVFRTGVQLGLDANDAATVYWFLAHRRGRRLLHSLHAYHPTPAESREAPVTIARVQRLMPAGAAYVTYGVFEDETFAVVITNTTHTLAKLGPTKAIAAACAAVDLSDAAKDPAPAIQALRKLVVAPLALPAGAKRVAFCAPDAPLARIPFAALAPELEVASAPTPEVAIAILIPAETSDERLVLGSEEDAKAWGGTRLDPAATTWRALTERLDAAPGWYLVALGSKLVPDPDGKSVPALAFAPAGRRGVVNAVNLANHTLSVRVLVLTGGAAGRMEPLPGDGEWGLSHTFLAAGASSVVASLWEPDAAAARAFGEKFVTSWWGETTKSAALKIARDHVRAQPQWKHPRFWAGWVLTGIWD